MIRIDRRACEGAYVVRHTAADIGPLQADIGPLQAGIGPLQAGIGTALQRLHIAAGEQTAGISGIKRNGVHRRRAQAGIANLPGCATVDGPVQTHSRAGESQARAFHESVRFRFDTGQAFDALLDTAAQAPLHCSGSERRQTESLGVIGFLVSGRQQHGAGRGGIVEYLASLAVVVRKLHELAAREIDAARTSQAERSLRDPERLRSSRTRHQGVKRLCTADVQ